MSIQILSLILPVICFYVVIMGWVVQDIVRIKSPFSWILWIAITLGFAAPAYFIKHNGKKAWVSLVVWMLMLIALIGTEVALTIRYIEINKQNEIVKTPFQKEIDPKISRIQSSTQKLIEAVFALDKLSKSIDRKSRLEDTLKGIKKTLSQWELLTKTSQSFVEYVVYHQEKIQQEKMDSLFEYVRFHEKYAKQYMASLNQYLSHFYEFIEYSYEYYDDIMKGKQPPRQTYEKFYYRFYLEYGQHKMAYQAYYNLVFKALSENNELHVILPVLDHLHPSMLKMDKRPIMYGSDQQ
ncbi:MAG: hypothetical protein HQK77_06095 [Desulfobacterales bacterium]|nr:hypothetical protein [Desulfobacterales bacterium]